MSDFRAAITAARRVVAFTGAGMSQESGIGTFRGSGGLWERFRPEEVATPEAFASHPERVARWYAERFAAMRAAEPNPGHRAIASWEALFPSLVVVTQNIDRLHQRAGSRDVVELHGTLWISRCARCGREVETTSLPEADPPPARCACDGLFRPGVVWFGEVLPAEAFRRAEEVAAACDLFVVVGTSATVWPAAGIIQVAAAAGATIVEVNRDETPVEELAALSERGAAGEVLPRLTEEWTRWRSPS